MARWVGTGMAVTVLVLAVTQLSCLAGDGTGSALGEPGSAVTRPATPVDVPVQFELEHTPGPGPVLTR